MRVAIFDFDGTIYKYETYSLMLEVAKHEPRFRKKFKPFYYSIIPAYAGYKMNLYPEAKMKYVLTQRYLQLLDGMNQQEVEGYMEKIAEKMRGNFNELVLERIEKHHQNADIILVVSGAYTPLLNAALKGLPIDFIIGTDIPTIGGRVNARAEIDHIQSKRKTECILKAMKENEVDWLNSYAYGDSIADTPVLEMVGNPVVVCPKGKLQSIAHQRKWQVIC